jgi:hypothetical protein
MPSQVNALGDALHASHVACMERERPSPSTGDPPVNRGQSLKDHPHATCRPS